MMHRKKKTFVVESVHYLLMAHSQWPICTWINIKSLIFKALVAHIVHYSTLWLIPKLLQCWSPIPICADVIVLKLFPDYTGTLNLSSVFNSLEQNDYTEESVLNSNQWQHISNPDGADSTSKLDPRPIPQHPTPPVTSL